MSETNGFKVIEIPDTRSRSANGVLGAALIANLGKAISVNKMTLQRANAIRMLLSRKAPNHKLRTKTHGEETILWLESK